MGSTTRALGAAALLMLAGCSAMNDPVDDPPEAQERVVCTEDASRCPEIVIAQYEPSTTPTFSGAADPAMLQDPAAPSRLWMLFSHLEGRLATGADGKPVGIPHVSTRLARSDDAGRTWRHAGTLWDSGLAADPEKLGPDSYFGSESTALAAAREGGATTWYAARIAYFLEPVTRYAPRYASSWVVRVASARGLSPEALAGAEEAVLGSATTHTAYGAHLRLNDLSAELGDCGLWNNPALFAEGGRLHLFVECVAFKPGGREDPERNRIVGFVTRPEGPPRAWTWAYGGVAADRSLAAALGGEDLVSPYVARSRDGGLLLALTPRQNGVGTGCVVLELEGLGPPLRLRRAADGSPVVAARQSHAKASGFHTGACAYDAASETGLVTVAAQTAGGLRARLRAAGLRP